MTTKPLKTLLTALLVLTLFSAISCRDEEKQPALLEIPLVLTLGSDTILTIEQIRPSFSATPLYPDIAHTEAGDGRIRVNGLKIGSTDINIRDEKNRNRVLLKVRVVRSYQLYRMVRYQNLVIAKDSLVRKSIEARLESELPYPLNGYYGFNLKRSELHLFPEGLGGPEIKGELVRLNSSGAMKLRYNNEVHVYVFSPTLLGARPASTSELNEGPLRQYGLIEDMTAAFQSKYSEADGRQVYRIQMLEPED